MDSKATCGNKSCYSTFRTCNGRADTKTHFSSNGLGAEVVTPYLSDNRLTINGEKVVYGDKITTVSFEPGGRIKFWPSQMTDSLAKGVQGVMQMVDAIDNGSFEAAPTFVGVTNINMALIAQRLGFTIVDHCRTADGSINRDLTSFTIVGKLDDIRRKVQEFKKAGTDQKLAQRNQRLKSKPTLATAG